MATDGPDPPVCDPDIFKHGATVDVTHGMGSNAVELYVRCAAYLSGQKVDWHFAGGRAAFIKTLGDVDKVRLALAELQPLQESFRQKHREGLPR